ncbi:MAG: serine hydroxymethyltransferase [Phycisphaeraceae bacterium]|nr:serine hydroxymethyltransferase [Phycisphaerales bacterium]MCB9842260.1 serine hydroxymethyltransferase [Phycisphaeraceae bacterium]
MAQDIHSHDEVADAVSELIRRTDPAAADLLDAERARQQSTLELIASENHVSPAVMHAMGTCLTNKYAEGYPGARYYGGCEFHDKVETLAQERAKQLFGCGFANVQPHSGAQANASVFLGLLSPGDTFASLVLADGGHLSHGLKVNMSGKWFNPVHYPLHYDANSPEFERIDYDAVRRVCLEHKPKLLMCGYSAYPRVIDFAKFRQIADECGALLMADIAHIAGLVAAGEHPSPFPHAHVVTTTTHKTLRGPRGGLIMTSDEEISKKINRALFPGMQGGPLMHVILSKVVAFGEALKPEFKQYAKQVIANAKSLAKALTERGFRITTGGTDNHLMLVDLRTRDAELTGADAEQWLERAGIITNKNGVPQDPRPPKQTSGLRLGTPAVTTRGLSVDDMTRVADWIDMTIEGGGDAGVCAQVRGEVEQFCERYPLG